MNLSEEHRSSDLRVELIMRLRASDQRTGQELVWFQVLFDPLSGALYSRGSDNRTAIWNTATGQLVKRVGQTSDWIISMALSPDGHVQAVGSADGVIVLWDTIENRALTYISDLGDSVRCVAFSPTGAMLASGDDSGKIILWDATTGDKLITLMSGYGWIQDLSFSGDGRTLASASQRSDNTITLFDPTAGNVLATIPVAARIESSRFDPGGPTLANGLADGSIMLWNTDTGVLDKVLRGHEGRVNAVAYSRDGVLLATGGQDATIRVWDPLQGQKLAIIAGHDANVMSVCFNQDGTLLASASEDGSIGLWRVAQRP